MALIQLCHISHSKKNVILISESQILFLLSGLYTYNNILTFSQHCTQLTIINISNTQNQRGLEYIETNNDSPKLINNITIVSFN